MRPPVNSTTYGKNARIAESVGVPAHFRSAGITATARPMVGSFEDATVEPMAGVCNDLNTKGDPCGAPPVHGETLCVGHLRRARKADL